MGTTCLLVLEQTPNYFKFRTNLQFNELFDKKKHAAYTTFLNEENQREFRIVWAQLFTSLIADLFQEMKQFLPLVSAIMEQFIGGITLLRHWYIDPNEKSDTRYNL